MPLHLGLRFLGTPRGPLYHARSREGDLRVAELVSPDMNPRLPLFLLGLVTSLALLAGGCAPLREHSPAEAKREARVGTPFARRNEAPDADSRSANPHFQARALPVGIRQLGDGSVKVFLPPRSLPAAFDVMSMEEARSLREALSLAGTRPRPHLRLVETPGPRRLVRPGTAQAGLRVGEEFLAGFGPGLLPLPDAVEDSPLLAALKMSPRFMGEGFQQAAEELFNSPLFIHGVYFSVMLYFSAWLAPEPFFSKAFAAALTLRLGLLVGLVELSRVAHIMKPLKQSLPPGKVQDT